MRALVLALLVACRADPGPPPATPPTDHFAALRERMIETTIVRRDVKDRRVVEALRKVPRQEFVPADLRERAYEDNPLPIGFDQTISQPYIVAVMTEAAQVTPGKRVLEIGTGSGYQAAVLSELGADVYTIEIVEPLGKRTEALLTRLGYHRIHTRIGDGYRGWPEAAPFDAIVVTAAPAQIPQPLIDQLAVGGKLVIPVGETHSKDASQELRVISKWGNGTTTQTLFDVRFVPMTGEAEHKP